MHSTTCERRTQSEFTHLVSLPLYTKKSLPSIIAHIPTFHHRSFALRGFPFVHCLDFIHLKHETFNPLFPLSPKMAGLNSAQRVKIHVNPFSVYDHVCLTSCTQTKLMVALNTFRQQMEARPSPIRQVSTSSPRDYPRTNRFSQGRTNSTRSDLSMATRSTPTMPPLNSRSTRSKAGPLGQRHANCSVISPAASEVVVAGLTKTQSHKRLRSCEPQSDIGGLMPIHM